MARNTIIHGRLGLLLPMMARTVAAQDQDDAFVMIADDSANGAILTDAEGKTLYLFTPATTAGTSNCNDQCAEHQAPLPAGDAMTLPEGVPGALNSIDLVIFLVCTRMNTRSLAGSG